MSLASIRQRDPVAAFAIARTLPLEGGYVDDAADPGGATNRGVSLRFALAEVRLDPALVKLFDVDHDGHVDRDDIAALTADQAADIYFECDWLPGWYGKLAPQMVAWKLFDVGVNAGPKRAATTLQRALVGLGARIDIDASVGPATIKAVQAAVQSDAGASLLGELRAVQAVFYRNLVATQPSLGKFLKGWLRRAAA